MSWRELLNFLEPLIPFLGVAVVLVAVAILALAITGSLAAVELRKFYRRQNAALEDADRQAALSISERELKNALQGAVRDAVAPLQSELIEVRSELLRNKPTQLSNVL